MEQRSCPATIVDTAVAAFLLDLVEVFSPVFDDGLDAGTLCCLALMGGRHPAVRGEEAEILLDGARCAALIKRLRLAGSLERDTDGRLSLSRPRTPGPRDPSWQAALTHVKDELQRFADHDGMSELRLEATAGA